MNTGQHKYCQQSEKNEFASHGEFSEPFFLNTKSTQAYLFYVEEVIVSDVHAQLAQCWSYTLVVKL